MNCINSNTNFLCNIEIILMLPPIYSVVLLCSSWNCSATRCRDQGQDYNTFCGWGGLRNALYQIARFG
jgi:hypothetical protein